MRKSISIMEKSTSSIIFKDLPIKGYERVIEVSDSASGLHAIISIHNSELGPALGGIRAYQYSSFERALDDVLRLSRGMTYKSAVTEVGTGGAKAVILTDGPKTEAQLRAFGQAVAALGGDYICAEDLGMSQADLAVISTETNYIVGTPKTSGDPSHFTAWGAFRGVEAVCQFLWKIPSVQGRTIAIQGLGAAGMKLAYHLFWSGAHLIVSDIDEKKCAYAAKAFGAKVVDIDEILSVQCDILAPCALGGIINDQSISRLNCCAIAGIANNQLLKHEDGLKLSELGILYAPDYVINSGGLINVCQEIGEKGYDAMSARNHVDRIYNLLITIFTLAEEKRLSTSQIADEIAESNLQQKIGKRTSPPRFQQ